MKVKELVEKLGLTVFAGGDRLDGEIKGGYVSDLLSDVMGFADEGDVWITLQIHKNIIAVASLKEVAAVILVKGLVPDEDTVRAAEEECVPLLGSGLSTFETAGKLYCAIKEL